MNQLIPCTHCQRHVRQSEASCPFCGGELALADVAPAALPRTRLGRAATFAFGATIVGAASLVGCSGDTTDGKEGSGGMMNGGAGGGVMPVYGAPAGAGGSSAGNANGGNGMGGGVAPAYGLPAGGTNDNGAGSGGKVNDGGGAQALYGAVPAAGSENGAGTGGGGGFPLYGAAPAD